MTMIAHTIVQEWFVTENGITAKEYELRDSIFDESMISLTAFAYRIGQQWFGGKRAVNMDSARTFSPFVYPHALLFNREQVIEILGEDSDLVTEMSIKNTNLAVRTRQGIFRPVYFGDRVTSPQGEVTYG